MLTSQRNTGGANSTSEEPPVFIDVFAGCGGLSLGLMRAGWRGLFAVEKDRFAFDTLATNFLAPSARYRYSWPTWLDKKPWCVNDLLAQHSTQLVGLRGNVDLLAGGPPCQGFSSAGRRRAVDPRNELVQRYLSLVDLIQPKVVLLENVLGITYEFLCKAGELNFVKVLETHLSDEYQVFCSTLKAASFGIPQSRPRFFLVALRKGQSLEFREETPFQRIWKRRLYFSRNAA